MSILPVLGTAKTFWNTIRTVSSSAVAKEADQGFKLAIVGQAEDRARLIAQFLTDKATEPERGEAVNYLREFDVAPDADLTRAFPFIVYAPVEGESRIGVRSGLGSTPFDGELAVIVESILARRADLAIPIARRLPAFRMAAAQQIIRETSRTNAQFALLSSLPALLPPVLGIFLPASAVADTLILTKNQVVLIMRLAAAHGHEPGYGRQSREIFGTVGAAFGWRTLARETIGLVPLIGPAIKAAIAYSGTFAAGQSALWFYQTGTFATPAQIRAMYEGSRGEAQKVVDLLRRRRETPDSPPIVATSEDDSARNTAKSQE